MGTNFVQRALLRRTIPYRTGFYIAFLPAIFMLALFWPIGGGNKVQMMAGKVTPGAQGIVTLTTTSNDNVKMDVKVQDLAKPTALTPPQSVYVLWIQPEGQPPHNEGEVKVDIKQSGQIHAQTSHNRFKVFITAEQSPEVKSPVGPEVLSADVVQARIS